MYLSLICKFALKNEKWGKSILSNSKLDGNSFKKKQDFYFEQKYLFH